MILRVIILFATSYLSLRDIDAESTMYGGARQSPPNFRVLGQSVRRDEQLIRMFLRGYKDRAGRTYRLAEQPDRAEREKPAIDCVAVSEDGERLGIEHTLVEPFEGQKADDQPFLAVFERLHRAPDLTVPDLLIDILVQVGAVPKGVDWKQAGERVLEWFRDVRLKLPVGESEHKVPGLGFDFTAQIEVMRVPDSPGVLVVGRIWPKEKPFAVVLRKALAAKLPKLVAANADKRILLVEDASMVLGLTIFAREFDAARDAFPKLANVEAIWLAHTPLWESEKVVWFFRIWPGGVSERFKIEGEAPVRP